MFNTVLGGCHLRCGAMGDKQTYWLERMAVLSLDQPTCDANIDRRKGASTEQGSATIEDGLANARLTRKIGRRGN